MEFRDVSENAIKCIVNEDDLEQWDITLEDLFANDEKAKGFIDEIVQIAEEEYDFVVENVPLAVQITSMGNEQLIFTISKIGNLGSGSIDLSDPSSIGKLLRDAMVKQFAQEKDTEKKKKKNGKKAKGGKEKLVKEKGPKDKKYLSIYFAEFSHAVEFCQRICVSKDVDSSLYMAKEGEIILVVKNNKSSNPDMERINWLSGEFAKKTDKKSLTSEYISEHYKILIKRNAISILAGI